MGILLAELVAKLTEDVPAEGGVPSALQYENAIKDAVKDFSEQCGVAQLGTLNIVSGTATYDLPADFLTLIKLMSLGAPDGVLHSAEGLIPVPASFCEKHTLRNGQITFYPTPRYTMARDFSYKAAWILTEATDEYDNAEYETLTEREARIILLKAQAIALTKQANAQAGTSIKYSFGAVSEDLGGMSDTTRKNSNDIEREYDKACERYNGQVGVYG